MCKIKFEIKIPGSVAIKVVNVIGIPISTLINEYNIPGKYEVDFNDEELIPGRYYYKIFSRVENYNWSLSSNNQSTVVVNGFDKLLQSGSLKVGSNGNGINNE